MKRSPDVPKAISLSRNAYDTYISTISIKISSSRFLIKNYYSCIIEYVQAILAMDGIALRSKDHHIEMIEYLKEQHILDEYQITILDNLRRIRNDIQYYGTKSDEDVNGFYELNKENILKIIKRLQERIDFLNKQE